MSDLRTEKETIKKAKATIEFIPDADTDEKCKDPQASRAKPNERLVTVFGIDNAFTTTDSKYKGAFTGKTYNLMRKATDMDKKDGGGKVSMTPDGDWSDLRACTLRYCDEYLARPENSDRFNLPGLVQFIALKSSLYYLFDEYRDGLDSPDSFDNIVLIGRRINELWLESKVSEDRLPKWKDQQELQDALRSVIRKDSNHSLTAEVPVASPVDEPPVPNHPDAGARPWAEHVPASLQALFDAIIWAKDCLISYFVVQPKNRRAIPLGQPDPEVPRHNPMNLILPAYETMWRVVMRCFMEIQYREAKEGSEWSLVMKEYLEELKHPDSIERGVFKKANEKGIKPIDIVKEGMRLYPPTRRVHRVFDDVRHVADIEECHRFRVLCRSDPLQFSPGRWQELARDLEEENGDREDDKKLTVKAYEEELGFMPFASHCPSNKKGTRGFGLKMVALLVAVLCKSIGSDWRPDDPERRLLEAGPLSSGREAYEDLQLVKRPPA